MRWFPLSLRPSPLPFTDQGAPLDPLCNHPKLCSFAPAPKNAVHFLYGAVLHRPALLPPLQSVFAKDTAFLSAKAQKLKNSAKQNSWRVCRFSLWNSAGCVRIWLEGLGKVGLGKVGLFGCQSGIRGLWLEGLSKEGLF